VKCKTEGEATVRRDPVGSTAQVEMVTEQTEVAFVPASERQYTAPSVADTIITVGQRGQQKRKRKRNLAPNEMEDGANMFDYTAGPSLLDACDVREVGPVTKKRNRGRFNRLYHRSIATNPDILARSSANAVREFPGSPQSSQPTQEW